MAGSITSYSFAVNDGRFEEAVALVKEMKASVDGLGAKSSRLLYAACAGEATGTMIFTVEHGSATAAGEAADKTWEDAKSLELTHRAAAANSPVSLISCSIYENVDI